MPNYKYQDFKGSIQLKGIDLIQLRRIYYLSLEEKSYDLTFSLPFYFEIKNLFKSNATTWVDLNHEFSYFIFKNFPFLKEKLLDYKPSYSQINVFSVGPVNNYSKHLIDDIYMNFSFSANHSVWFLVDILKIVGINSKDVVFKIARQPGAEYADVIEIIISFMEESFFKFLRFSGKSEINANVIINNMRKINKIQSTLSRSYINFYLIDNGTTLSRVKKEFFSKTNYSSKQVDIMKHVLDLYTEFFVDICKSL